VFAGSGGFKTVSAASTLIHWTGAAVVLDPSRELGPMLSAARASMGHKVVSLEPGTPGGINVLDWIDVTHPLAETNVHAVVGWIFGEAEGGSSDTDKFFRNWGKQLVACRHDQEDRPRDFFWHLRQRHGRHRLALRSGLCRSRLRRRPGYGALL
jgi:type IV secretion system protein VirD4